MSLLPHSLCSFRRFSPRKQPPAGSSSRPGSSLAETPVGTQVQVTGFRAGLAVERRSQLQSYGLAPGHTVKVLQHTPVTVLLIEQFELALERELAAVVEGVQSRVDRGIVVGESSFRKTNEGDNWDTGPAGCGLQLSRIKPGAARIKPWRAAFHTGSAIFYPYSGSGWPADHSARCTTGS